MERIPFTVYDFLGYLAGGFVTLAAIDYAFNLHWLLAAQVGFPVWAVWLVAVYITGHIVANLAGYLIEKKLVRDRLSPPYMLLFRDQHVQGVGNLRGRLLAGYHQPLPKMTRLRILSRAKERVAIDEPGEDLFFHCYEVAKHDPPTRAKLDNFLNLYGFCRNVCLALFFAAPVLFVGWVSGHAAEYGWVAALAALVGSVGMLYRYLKLFRDYHVEVFRSYPDIPGAQIDD